MKIDIEQFNREVYTKAEISKIPKKPGCYIYRNPKNDIIYIGKSKLLRNRVRQYFYGENLKESKYYNLVKELHKIEIIVTDTETNALILECQLIKKYMPKYNSMLKKTRSYTLLEITLKRDYLWIIITDKATAKNEYFASFRNQDDAYSTLELINSIWQTPLCSKDSFSRNHRPCLNYHLHKCLGPCCGKVEADVYNKKINELVKCLKGDYNSTLRRLKREMEIASKELNFERAACLRDSINGLKFLEKKQKKHYTPLDGKNVYLFFRAFGEENFSLFFIRDKIVINREDFSNIYNFDIERTADFISSSKARKDALEDGRFLCTCLLEIGADKLFVPISNRIGAMGILKRLEYAYKEFSLVSQTK